MQFLIDIILILSYSVALLFLVAWVLRLWKVYINQKFIDKFNEDSVLLEIKLPREINKSPLATETAISSLLQTGSVGTNFDREWKGNLTAWSSLEIASIEGVVRFFVRANKKFRPLVESNFYAQYPGIEIVEADDYTKKMRYNHLTTDSVSCWAQTYKLTKSWDVKNKYGENLKKKDGKNYDMPKDFLPIKTYVDFGLDKDPKEEYKNDPLTYILEFMGSVGKGEHVWYQIIVQDESNFNGKKFPKTYLNEVEDERWSLSDMASQYKKQLRKAKTKKKGTPVENEYGGVRKVRKEDGTYEEVVYEEDVEVSNNDLSLTNEEIEEVKAINRKLSKPLARVIIRLVYVADKQKYKFQYINNAVSLLKGYSGANSFRPAATADPYDYPWQSMGGKRVHWRTEELFDAYVGRAGLHPFYSSPNSDESVGSIDWWEDGFFYPYPSRYRKAFHLVYDILFHPFTKPEANDVIVLNLEEIATLWHLPGAVATTPTLPRIDSTKGVAPVNLPV